MSENGHKATSTVNFDRPKLERLKKALADAKAGGAKRHDVFTFEGEQYVVAYAGYVIEHVDKTLSP